MRELSPGMAERSGAETVIIDVRTEREFVGGHIEGAIHIPYSDIEAYIEEIRSWNKPVLLYSTYGMRSHIALCKLRNTGIRAMATTRDKLLQTPDSSLG